jgi:hypothetical protein
MIWGIPFGPFFLLVGTEVRIHFVTNDLWCEKVTDAAVNGTEVIFEAHDRSFSHNVSMFVAVWMHQVSSWQLSFLNS